MSFVKMIVGFCALVVAPLVADTIVVIVRCSDGMDVPNLRISVYDSAGTHVAGVTKTDINGIFAIQNSETYSAPFNMFLTAHDGSSCGAYNVVQETPDSGFVYLNYYPINMPCSCSNYTERSATYISN